MRIAHTIAELRSMLASGPRPALVPTMGGLHDGHLSLVRLARGRGRPVVVTIFVNRLQFAPHEDFDQYPRTFESDAKCLAAEGCDVLFAPSENEMYPLPQTYRVSPPAELAGILEGAVRPGFFTGVCTVVLKLLNIAQPELAVFGKKDYQQWLIVQNMVKQLALPIEIIGADTIREPGGLALSSRNTYLTGEQRPEALRLHATLKQVVDAIKAGDTDWPELERKACGKLTAHHWKPDYLSIRRQDNLGKPQSGVRLVVLAAARIGSTRLIDNLEVP